MCIPKYNTNNIGVSSGDYYYITLEAIDTYNNSPCTFQTYVSEWYQTSEHGYLVVETYIARLKGMCSISTLLLLLLLLSCHVSSFGLAFIYRLGVVVFRSYWPS